MDKVVGLGTGRCGVVWCRIKIDENKKGIGKAVLSITGVEGPKYNGDCTGSCGQILDSIEIQEYAAGWDAELVTRFLAIWDRWHLNSMRPTCEHQRANWDTTKKIEVVRYHLTHEAMQIRRDALKAAETAGLAGTPLELNPTARALAESTDWFDDRFQPPDADSPLSGCYEVKKREMKAVGWTYPTEHPEGILSKPCEVCGYKYGSAWLYEPLPDDVIAFLEALPEPVGCPAWV
jgi:hypothetical protein